MRLNWVLEAVCRLSAGHAQSLTVARVLSGRGACALRPWSAGWVGPRRKGSYFPDQGSNPPPLYCKADS